MHKVMLLLSLILLNVGFTLQAQVEKISSDLQEVMAQRGTDELIPIVIRISPQPDLDDLNIAIRGMTKSLRRNYITTQLKTMAATAQGNVLSYLALKENEDKAQMVNSFFLANVVAVNIQNHLVNDIAAISEVNYIFLDHESFDLASTTWNVEKIRADDVWQNFGYTGDGVIVGVMDTGIDYDHEDLAGNIWVNPAEDLNGNGRPDFYPYYGGGDLDYQDNDNNGKVDDLVGWDWNNGSSEDNDPMDDYGHGTHVAGTIAGDGSAGTQTGVAPDAKIMILKIWQDGSGLSSNYWSAVEYALENEADVVNLSGGKRYYQVSDAEKATFRQVFETAIIAGMIIVVAAGNEGDYSGGYNPPNNIRTPGNVPLVITVGATDDTDNIASFSSRGPVEWWNLCKDADEWGNAICYNDYPYPPGLIKPDVSAPGVNITSTQWGGGYVGGWNGTSMATPATSGVVALMLEAAPNMTPEMAKDILEGTALNLGPAGKDSLYGSGRIDAYDALKYTIEQYGGTFAQDLVIPSGETWTISPGVTLKFTSGRKLIIYGTLIAEGTSGDPITFIRSGSSGTWGGIRFEDSSMDTSVIKYADIEYATYGVYCNRANPKIQYNTISDCNYGLYLYYSSPTYVETNSIQDNNYGIYGISSNALITDNLIRDNSVAGVSFSGGAPIFYNNTIKRNGYGAYFVGGSRPKFGPTSDTGKGNNVLTENSYGIEAWYYCDPFMGTHHPGAGVRFGGYNSIYGNFVRDATAYFDTHYEAEYNWWGTSPVRLASYGSSINYSFALSSDPGGGSSLGKSVVIVDNDRWAGFDPDNPDINSLSDLWLWGHYLFIDGKLEDAIAVYQMLVNKFSVDDHANRALVKIYHLYRETGKKGFADYLNGLLNNPKIDANVHHVLYLLLLNTYLDEEDINGAMITGEAIMNSFTDSFIEKTALYYLVLASLNDLKDRDVATGYLELIKQKYPDAEFTYLAREAMGEQVNWSMQKIAGTPENVDVSLPAGYALHHNYPNPFNPSTTIRYELPVASRVQLTIYDVMGREVYKYTAVEEAGYRQLVWQGKNHSGQAVPSGVYICRLVAISTANGNHFTASRKMLLLK